MLSSYKIKIYDMRISLALISITLLSLCANIAIAEEGACRKVKPRGVGVVLQYNCNENEELYGGLCYPKCKEGYEAIGCCICRKKGCEGLSTDIGVSCAKPKAYGRGAGYVLWNHGKCVRESGGECERNGLLWYPKCKPGYHPVGCCVCSPDCPEGYRDDGAFCVKDSYGRGGGITRPGCADGHELDGGLCYPTCPNGFNGMGPVCWANCAGNMSHTCNPQVCATNSTTCVSLLDSASLSLCEYSKHDTSL
jgi:hypothetical protein